jgi:HEAT repeat protein
MEDPLFAIMAEPTLPVWRRRAALWHLVDAHHPHLTPAWLLHLLSQERDAQFGGSLVRVLASLGAPARQAVLTLAAARNTPPAQRQVALSMLSLVFPPPPGELLLAVATGTEEAPEVRATAIAGLGHLRPVAPISLLREALTCDEPRFCVAAAQALGQSAEQAAVAPLLAAFPRADDRLRPAIAEALWLLACVGRNIATAPLLEACLDTVPAVRANALKALICLTERPDRQITAALLQALADPEPLVRRAVVAGVEHRPWLVPPELLLRHLHDPNLFVRLAAEESLRWHEANRHCKQFGLFGPTEQFTTFSKHHPWNRAP